MLKSTFGLTAVNHQVKWPDLVISSPDSIQIIPNLVTNFGASRRDEKRFGYKTDGDMSVIFCLLVL